MGNVTIFTKSSLIHCYKMVFVFHHHLSGWKSWEKVLDDFYSQFIFFPSILQNHTVVKRRGESSCSLYLLRQNQQKQSILHTVRTFPVIMGKSLEFDVLAFSWISWSLEFIWSSCFYFYWRRKLTVNHLIWSPVYPILKNFTKKLMFL